MTGRRRTGTPCWPPSWRRSARSGRRTCRAAASGCGSPRRTSTSSAGGCTASSTSTPGARSTRTPSDGRSTSGCIRRPDALHQAMTSSAQTQVTESDLRVTLNPMTTAYESSLVDEPDDSTGSYALEERGALRRVAGLSTELADITEVEYRQLRLERVVLVGVWTEGTAADADRSLA